MTLRSAAALLAGSDRGEMVLKTVARGESTTAWDRVVRLGDADGSGAHPHVARLLACGNQRDLSDAVHALCAVHGSQSGVIDKALVRCVQGDALDWLAETADAFAEERAYLARLTAAAGPLPSTPGQSETEAMLGAQRHTLEMLAGSEREGCATGAIAALLIDWRSIRLVLDKAADRFGTTVPPSALPDGAKTGATVATLGHSLASERAIGFGAQQLFAQHHGLWDLLEARASARDAG